jgi:hypothetical protein
MSDSYLERTEALRQEALEGLFATKQFRAYKALDEAVSAMGGTRQLALQGVVTLNGTPLRTAGVEKEMRKQRRRRKLSQADGAEQVLKETGSPMPSNFLMPAVAEKGIVVSSGPNAITNFGSTLSRDPRFFSFRHESTYYWWIKGVDLPAPFKNEAPDLPLQVGSDASSSSSQEGGDAHAATTA